MAENKATELFKLFDCTTDRILFVVVTVKEVGIYHNTAFGVGFLLYVTALNNLDNVDAELLSTLV